MFQTSRGEVEQISAHGGLLDCWGFPSIIVGSLRYDIKLLETTAVVICCYIDKIEKLFYSRLALLASYCKMAPMLVKCCSE